MFLSDTNKEPKNRFISDDLSEIKGLSWIRDNYDPDDVDDWSVQEKDYVLGLGFEYVGIYEESIPLLSNRQWGIIPRGYEHPSEAPKMVVFPQYRNHREFMFTLTESLPDKTELVMVDRNLKIASFDEYGDCYLQDDGNPKEVIHDFLVKLCVEGVSLEMPPESNEEFDVCTIV